jgi:hypothetical protein
VVEAAGGRCYTARLTRPSVGLMPAMPQKAAAPQIEPPVSVPMPPRISPAAMKEDVAQAPGIGVFDTRDPRSDGSRDI